MIQWDWVIPMFIAPMQPESYPEPFSDDGWLFEPKLDGLRIIYSRREIETRLWDSSRTECTRFFPELYACPFPEEAVLDGVLCCKNPDTGLEDVQLVLERFRLSTKGRLKKNRIHSFSLHRPVHFVVWDILYYKGRDLRDLPLIKRRSILESILTDNPLFSVISYQEGSGEQVWDQIRGEGDKGIVAKRMDSKYVSRPSHDWLTITKNASVSELKKMNSKQGLCS